MNIEAESCRRGGRFNEEGSYIHRYYLPEQLRDELQPQDMDAIYQKMMMPWLIKNSRDEIYALMLAEPCCIRYRAERMVKEVPADLLLVAIDACINYHRDSCDYSLSVEETNFLMGLNERLRKLEDDINVKCFHLNRELQERQSKGEPFLDDYEIDVEMQFYLRDNHPLYSDDYDNIIFEGHHWKTAYSDNLDGWLEKEREEAVGDWNDARGATNPAIRNNPLFNTSHCRLFHELQSRSPVPLKHLCGIGTIWVDIKILQQASFKISEV